VEINMRFLLAILLCLGSARVLAIDLNGQSEFVQRLALNSSISARVEVINVSVGQQVAAGEVLLSLVSTGLQARVGTAGARVNSLAPTVDRMLVEMEKAQELFDRDSLALVELQIAEQNYAIAQANLAGAQARLAGALFHLSQADIRSPINGIVLSIATFSGQFINTAVNNQTMLTVVDNSSMTVQSLLPLEFWKESLMDKPAQVDFQQQSYQGKVVGVSKQVTIGDNNHPAITLRIEFATDGKLAAGLPLKISINDD
jgi:multidrug efflux pump subunit AcrA (membrane-fusion protein)